MTDTLVAMTPPTQGKKESKDPSAPSVAELAIARELVAQARERGLSLTGRDGLLKVLTKTVIEAALEEEMNAHLGF